MRPFAVVALALAALPLHPIAQRPPREAAVPFTIGETLTYDVAWSAYLVAGTAVATVAEKRPALDGTAYYIVADGRPAPLLSRLYNLAYKMDTLLDSYTLLPHRGSVYIEEGTSRHLAVTRFDRTAHTASFEVQDDPTFTAAFEVPPQVQDGLSALYVLRAMTFKPGDRLALPVTDEGALYRLQMDVGASERVSVPLGSIDAWNVKASILDAQGEPAMDNVTIWISTDTRRLPVKLEAGLPVGTFVLSLRDAR